MSKTHNTSGTESIADSKETARPLACDVTALTHNDRERLMAISNELFGAAKEIREIDVGYELTFPDIGSDMAEALSYFVTHDSLCCPFIRHSIVIEPYSRVTILRLDGGPGVKEYIGAELERGLLDDRRLS